MKFFLLISILICTSLFGMATEKNNSEFKNNKNIIITGKINIQLVPYKGQKIKIVSGEKYHNRIQLEETDSTVMIFAKRSFQFKNIIRNDTNKVYLYTPSFSKLTIIGPSNVTMTKELYVNNSFSVKKHGSGYLKVKINAPIFNCDISGSGNFNLYGLCKRFNIKIDGTGDGKLNLKRAEKGHIYSKNSGYIKAKVESKELEYNKKGRGDLNLILNANEFCLKKDGTGVLHIRGRANKSNINILGKGNINASNLEINDVNIRSNSKASISINAKKMINAIINKNGKLFYKNHPNINAKIKGKSIVIN